MTHDERNNPNHTATAWILARRQYDALVDMCSDGDYDIGVLNLKQTGMMRLAARFGFKELIAREITGRQDELLATEISFAKIRVEVPTPLIEAICGDKQTLPGFEPPSLADRQSCIRQILQTAPKSANIPDPDGSMPLELASCVNEPFYVEEIVSHVSNVNAGWYTPIYYAILNEQTAPPGMELYKSQAVKNCLRNAGGIARPGEIAELRAMLEPGSYGLEIYNRPPQKLLQLPST